MILPAFIMYHNWMLDNPSTFKQLLDDEDKRRRDRRYPRASLRVYKYSSFEYLYTSGNNQALLNATGHDHRTFALLLSKFRYTYDYHMLSHDGTIRKKRVENDGSPKGRPRDLNAIGALGMVLMWFRTRGSCARSISMHFGQTSTPMYKWLKFARKCLLHALSRDVDSKVLIPTISQVKFFQEVIGAKYPLCSDVWAAADGLKLLIQKSTDERKQNMHYNGWKSGHYINCVFVYTPDGKIALCVLNAPGTFHYSTMAHYGIYEGMERIYELCEGKVVVDSAFKISDGDYLIKSSQCDPFDNDALRLNRQATTIRQLSEWGMRMIQAAFPRLKEALIYEEKGDRMVILRLMVNLYNFHCHHIGINIIQNSYTEKTNFFGHQSIDDDANAML